MQRIRTLSEKSALQERFKNHEDESDRYLSNIFWMIFLTKGASGFRQTSFLFFQVALQKEKEDSRMSAGAADPGRADFGLAKVTVDTTAHADLHDFYSGALRSCGDHLQISDHSVMNQGCVS